MDPPTLRRVEWRQLFPFLWLFGAFRIAVDPRKLILAALGLCFVTGGNHAIDLIGLRSEATELEYPWKLLETHTLADGIEPLTYLTDPGELLSIFSNWKVLIDPLLEAAAPPAFVLANSYQHGFAVSVDALLRLLWFALVWGVFGGAITRMAIHQFVKDEKLSLVAGLKFSTGRILDYLSAPLLPLGGTFFLLLIIAGFGLLSRIPGIGPLITSVLIGISLLLSVGIVIMLIGVGAGWPLMIAAIGTEDSDGFDGFSRAHSYIFDVPWYYLWTFVVAMIYASAAVFFAELAVSWIIHINGLGIAWGAGGSIDAPPDSLSGSLIAFWSALWAAFVIGFRISLFWCLFLLIYLVLRNISDRIPMNEAFLEPLQQGQERAMALGGLAGVQEVVTERPIVTPEGMGPAVEENRPEPPNQEENDVSEEKPDE
jgi:hypothetical protein